MSRLRLLLVEDNPDDAELVLAELGLAGIEVDSRRVDSAAAMQAALAESGWDLVVSDYNLPSFSAEGALALTRGHDPDLPFIVVSGWVGEEISTALMRAGAHDFIVKGNYSRLVPAIERELREAEVRRERRQAQASLAESENLLRGITAALGEGLLVQDMEGQLLLLNQEAERLLGWTESELKGRDVHGSIHYLRSDGTPYPREECPILSLVSFGSFYRCEDEVFVRKDGTMFPVSYVVTPLRRGDEIVAAVTAFQDITERKQAEAELIESRRRLRELSAFLQNVREEERTRIARELHDELGQALTALRIDLDWLQTRLPEPPRAVTDKLAAMQSLVAKTVESVRRISQDLRPGVLDDLGLAAAVEWLVEQFQARAGIPCRLVLHREEFDLPDSIATSIFRIVQEALTNVARHADAGLVEIELAEVGNGIRLMVRDDGKGFDSQAKPGTKSYGLLGIRERVHMLGGTADISGSTGQGTTVQVWIPFERMQTEP
jgi:two-component system sensor histidine kinase UhpB